MTASTIRGTTAKVTVTLEVSGGSWGDGCTVEQVHRQAVEEDIGKVHRLISTEHGLRIVGSPSVSAVISSKEDAQ